jgi:hypothetical protein
MDWTRVDPVFPVSDIALGDRLVQPHFGFEPLLVNPPDDPFPAYAILRRDSVSLHLVRRDEARTV